MDQPQDPSLFSLAVFDLASPASPAFAAVAVVVVVVVVLPLLYVFPQVLEQAPAAAHSVAHAPCLTCDDDDGRSGSKLPEICPR